MRYLSQYLIHFTACVDSGDGAVLWPVLCPRHGVVGVAPHQASLFKFGKQGHKLIDKSSVW